MSDVLWIKLDAVKTLLVAGITIQGACDEGFLMGEIGLIIECIQFKLMIECFHGEVVVVTGAFQRGHRH